MSITLTRSRLILVLVIVSTVVVASAAVITAVLLGQRGAGPTNSAAANLPNCIFSGNLATENPRCNTSQPGTGLNYSSTGPGYYNDGNGAAQYIDANFNVQIFHDNFDTNFPGNAATDQGAVKLTSGNKVGLNKGKYATTNCKLPDGTVMGPTDNEGSAANGGKIGASAQGQQGLNCFNAPFKIETSDLTPPSGWVPDTGFAGTQTLPFTSAAGGACIIEQPVCGNGTQYKADRMIRCKFKPEEKFTVTVKAKCTDGPNANQDIAGVGFGFKEIEHSPVTDITEKTFTGLKSSTYGVIYTNKGQSNLPATATIDNYTVGTEILNYGADNYAVFGLKPSKTVYMNFKNCGGTTTTTNPVVTTVNTTTRTVQTTLPSAPAKYSLTVNSVCKDANNLALTAQNSSPTPNAAIYDNATSAARLNKTQPWTFSDITATDDYYVGNGRATTTVSGVYAASLLKDSSGNAIVKINGNTDGIAQLNSRGDYEFYVANSTTLGNSSNPSITFQYTGCQPITTTRVTESTPVTTTPSGRPSVVKKVYDDNGSELHTFAPGDNVTFGIQINNPTGSTVSNISVSDTPTSSLGSLFDLSSFQDVSSPALASGESLSVGDYSNLKWTGISVSANSTRELKFKLKLKADLTSASQDCKLGMTNNVTITFSGFTPPMSTSNTTITVQIPVEKCQPNLSIVKTVAPATVSGGGKMTVTIKVSNSSSVTQNATVYEVTDYLPPEAGFTFNSSSVKALTDGVSETVTFSESGSNIKFTVGGGAGASIAPGKTLTITFTVTAPDSSKCGAYLNTASVTNPNGPTGTANMTVTGCSILPDTGLTEDLMVSIGIGGGFIAVSYVMYRYNMLDRLGKFFRSRGSK